MAKNLSAALVTTPRIEQADPEWGEILLIPGDEQQLMPDGDGSDLGIGRGRGAAGADAIP